MNRIKLHGIRTYSYHGCLKEESIVGGNYLVNVSVDCDFKVAANADDLAKTVDHVELKNIVILQMSITNKLIETVAYNIINDIKEKFSIVVKCTVEIKKINPPLDGDVDYVSVVVEE